METQMSQTTKDVFDSGVFKKIEERIIREAVLEASKTARREIELFKFELVYPMIVSKKERDEIEEFIDDLRNKKWQDALKKANGNEEKALML